MEQDPEYHETRETLWEAGGTTLQGETLIWTDSEKNPGRGMKENLKPYVYKQSKRFICATACLLKNEPASCWC